jgi:RNA polymerase sigma factor (sigma-70 family)
VVTGVADDVGTLVRRAAAGDRGAWTDLVNAYSALIFSIARAHRLSDADATDVSQTTWLRLVEHIDRLDDPSKVGAWLATTARRESLRVIGVSARQVPTANEAQLEPRINAVAGLDSSLLAAERVGQLNEALAQLPDRCAQMLLLLMGDEPVSYHVLSERLDMPIGSIGPTRARCLRKLRTILDQMDAGQVFAAEARATLTTS